jgi:uncharacterized protein YkwD
MMYLERVIAGVLLLSLLSACGIVAPREAVAVLPTAHVILEAPTPSADATTAASPAAQSSTSLSLAAAPTETTAPTPTAAMSVTPTAPTLPPSITATATLSAAVDADLSTLEAGLVAAINQERAANSLPPYLNNAELNAAARAHSCDMAAHTLISHTSSDGRSPKDRLAGSKPPWERLSESIAAGSDDPAVIVAMWMDEPPDGWHRRNILDTELHEVGVGYCYTSDDSTGNHHYWTADFARHSTT